MKIPIGKNIETIPIFTYSPDGIEPEFEFKGTLEEEVYDISKRVYEFFSVISPGKKVKVNFSVDVFEEFTKEEIEILKQI